MLYCDYTNCPNIFKGTYWGDFDTDITTLSNQCIFNNRNKFVADFKLKKFITDYPLWVENEKSHKDFDHVEVYKDIHNQYVIIFSNYGEIDDIASENCYKKYSPLYCDWATTYVKILPKIKKCHEIIYPDIFNTL